jgi:hypothetical protein
MRLSFRYEPEDLVEVALVARRRLPFPLAYLRYAMIGGIAFILLTVIWAEIGAYRSRTIRWADGTQPFKDRVVPYLIMIVCVVGIVGIWRASTPLAQAKRTFATQKSLGGEQLLEATPDGMTMISADTVTRWQWSGFVGMIECERAFLLERDRNHFVVVPKRAFADSAQVAEFRELVQCVAPLPR